MAIPYQSYLLVLNAYQRALHKKSLYNFFQNYKLPSDLFEYDSVQLEYTNHM